MRILTLLAGAVVATAVLVPILDDPPLTTGCYVQNLRADGATVLLVEAAPRRIGAAVAERVGVEASGEVRVGDLVDTRRRHAFRFSGLESGVEYRYRVEDASGRSLGGGTFRTLATDPGQTVRFGVIGDSGDVPWWGWMQQSPLFHPLAAAGWLPLHGPTHRIGELAAAQDLDWFLHVGDVVYPLGEHRFYGPVFFRPFADLLANSAVYLVVGNHDDGNNKEDGAEGRPLLQNFELPRNDFTGDERMYTFVDGAVRVVGADCSFLLHGGAEGGLDDVGQAQRDLVLKYFDRVLSSAGERWKVVFLHYPLRTSDPRRQSAWTRDVLLPMFERHGVDLAFAGHDHNYQRYGEPGTDRTIAVVSGGGGKDLYEIEGDGAGFAVRKKAYHFCSVEITGGKATVVARDQWGEELDRFTIEK